MVSKKQPGFSMIIGIVAAILVIAVVGYGGYRLYNHYNQPSKQTNNATSTSQNTNQTPIGNSNQSSTRAQPVDPNAGYFVIKEWEVRFKPVSGLGDLKYALRFNNNQAVFSTTAITLVDPKC